MLRIEPEKVCFVIVKAREFDIKVEVDDPDPGSNPSDDGMRAVFEDYGDDATFEEIKAFLDALNEGEQVSLVALAWLGRGDFTADEWEAALDEARRAHNEHTSTYLLGMPLLPDYLEEGLSQLGYSCEEYEMGRL
ncbi:MAG: DUF3775 domain-containing protein [Alphaproteobacteria bacterium]